MKNNANFPERVTLAYFSGTGCTEAVCNCFAEQLSKLNIEVNPINMAVDEPADMGESDLLIILSPVHAFRLASITEKWVAGLPVGRNISTAIISVSGGGEISPNTACDLKCKRILGKKGYYITYEKMIVMPSNFASQAAEHLNLELIRALPHKVNGIIEDILAGKKRVLRPKLQDRFFAIIGKSEHLGARFFGAAIKVSDECSHCGACADNCPRQNIKMAEGIPKFGFSCMWCMKCIYGCPCGALSPGIIKFSVLKDGFDMRQMTEAAKQEPYEVAQDECEKELLCQGVIDYLHDDDEKGATLS